jgi:RNA polymerase sigma-70 factor (ECF subfamily)
MPTPLTPADDVTNAQEVPRADTQALEMRLEQLYRDKHSQFVRVALAITADADAAHDAVQEGFAHALRANPRLRRRDAIEPWLWRIVVNAARDRRRADARRRLRETGDADFDEVAAPRQRPKDESIADAIAALPERQRLVLFLRYYADLDHGAIARAVGIRPGTVGATLHSAHASLRRRLEETS